MDSMELAVVEDMISSLAEVTIRWCRKMEDPVNSVHGDITLVADDFEQHAWRVQQKLNSLRERLQSAREDGGLGETGVPCGQRICALGRGHAGSCRS